MKTAADLDDKAKQILKELINDSDQDVKYYSQKIKCQTSEWM